MCRVKRWWILLSGTDLKVFTQKGTKRNKGWHCNKQQLDGRSQTADGSEEDQTSRGILAKQLRDVLKGKHPRGVGVKGEVVFEQGGEHLTWRICGIGYWGNQIGFDGETVLANILCA